MKWKQARSRTEKSSAGSSTRGFGTARWGVTGLCLVGLHIGLLWLSSRFDYGLKNADKPVIALVSMLVLAGAAYFLALMCSSGRPSGNWTTGWILGIGLALRLTLWTSTPMLEDDFYRYLWDGGVLANGINPYSYAPGDLLSDETPTERVPSRLHELAEESGVVVQRVNHPRLRTIYPPVAQSAFAVAHLMGPWDLQAWRGVLLVFDGLALALLALLLRRAGMPVWLLAVYWWNPVLVKETYNSCHMDVLVLPFVLGATLMTLQERRFISSALLALGVGAKLWPVLLLPIILRPLWRRPLHLVGAVATFGVVAGALLLPVLLSRLDTDSGFVAYARRWEMNDALYIFFLWGAQGILWVLGNPEVQPHLIARGVGALLLCTCIAVCVRRDFDGPRDLYRRSLWVLAAAFLLSPTQFPWYFIWLLPFLTLSLNPPLLLLTILLPLYYLRFHLRARNCVELFDYGIVWVEFVPVWVALTWLWLRTKRRSVSTGEQ